MPKLPQTKDAKFAKAYPRKHFFFEMFTRDISLEDCILDLIDNSIDGLVRKTGIDIPNAILDRSSEKKPKKVTPLAKIVVSYSEKEFRIEDTCGGIDRNLAVEDIFNFGHAEGEAGGVLGVYGIGLKRAIFKIGHHFRMESETEKEGFKVDLNVRKWAKEDKNLEDWRIPIEFTDGATSEPQAGTKIIITDLRSEVKMRMNDGTLASRLHTTISQTYGLFIDRYVEIELNGTRVEPFEIPIGGSDAVQSAHEEFKEGDVTVRIFASLAARNEKQEWVAERAGWYALCNGRVVVAADKTELTGWGVQGAQVWHMGKYRGFIGVAFFQSSNALALPWTTTKRGLNRESAVYQRARNAMRTVGKPVLTFLDNMYKPDSSEESSARQIADTVKAVPLAELAKQSSSDFRITYRTPSYIKTTVRVQYEAEKSDIEKVRKKLKKPSLGANHVGLFTFNHYLKTECPE